MTQSLGVRIVDLFVLCVRYVWCCVLVPGELFRILNVDCSLGWKTSRAVIASGIIAVLRGVIARLGLSEVTSSDGGSHGTGTSTSPSGGASRKVAFAVLDTLSATDSKVIGDADESTIDHEALEALEKAFVYAVVWAAGGLLPPPGRVKFEAWLRNKLGSVGKASILPSTTTNGSGVTSRASVIGGSEDVYDPVNRSLTLFDWIVAPASMDWEPLFPDDPTFSPEVGHSEVGVAEMNDSEWNDGCVCRCAVRSSSWRQMAHWGYSTWDESSYQLWKRFKSWSCCRCCVWRCLNYCDVFSS
jgi:hypothetical protein